MTGFSFGDIWPALHAMHPSEVGAFRARLRYFKQHGLPPGTNTGKGAAADYDVPGFLQLAVALELAEAGLKPALIVEIVLASRATIIAAAKEVELHGATSRLYNPVILMFEPESLRVDNGPAGALVQCRANDISHVIGRRSASGLRDARRAIIINCSSVFAQALRNLDEHSAATRTVAQFSGKDRN